LYEIGGSSGIVVQDNFNEGSLGRKRTSLVRRESRDPQVRLFQEKKKGESHKYTSVCPKRKAENTKSPQ
jgi:hypothetical protein